MNQGGGPGQGVLTSSPTGTGSGVFALDPLPFDDLDLSGFGTAHVVPALHRHSEFLVLTVRTDEVHVGDLTDEVPVGALDVEVSGHVVSFDLKVL